jgi:histidyl-tRNA synthetase
MFRYDRPGAGRYRQFHQLGVEVVGSASPTADAEVTTLLWQYLRQIGLTKLGVRLNTLGCKACRTRYSGILKDFLKGRLGLLCGDCHERFARNPLRVLDCKVTSCKAAIVEAPEVGAILCEECVRHFDKVKALLAGAGVSFNVDAKLVRGLDYYTRTVFEVFHEALGVENSVGGGGRYDHLVEEIGGPATPAVGFSAGLERLVAAVQAEGLLGPEADAVEVFVASLGERSLVPAFRLAADLRTRHRVWLEFDPRRIDRQMGTAAKLGARHTVIIGDDEIAKGVVKVKDMDSGEQVEIGAEAVGAYLEAKAGGERLE